MIAVRDKATVAQSMGLLQIHKAGLGVAAVEDVHNPAGTMRGRVRVAAEEAWNRASPLERAIGMAGIVEQVSRRTEGSLVDGMGLTWLMF